MVGSGGYRVAPLQKLLERGLDDLAERHLVVFGILVRALLELVGHRNGNFAACRVVAHSLSSSAARSIAF